VCVCVRVCVHACVYVCVRACVCVHVCLAISYSMGEVHFLCPHFTCEDILQGTSPEDLYPSMSSTCACYLELIGGNNMPSVLLGLHNFSPCAVY